MRTCALTTTVTEITRDKIKGSIGKRRRRTEDAEDWSKSRRQQWATGVSSRSFGLSLEHLNCLFFFLKSVQLFSGRVEDGLKVVHKQSNSAPGGFGGIRQSSVRAFKLKSPDVNGDQPFKSFKYNSAINSKWKVSCCHQ